MNDKNGIYWSYAFHKTQSLVAHPDTYLPPLFRIDTGLKFWILGTCK
jgi:hypothetical protein